MVNTEVVRTVIGIVGNVTSFGVFPSPGPKLYRIIKNKSVEELEPRPYLTTTMYCFWVVYGMPFVKPGMILVVTANGIGLALQMAYLIIFLLYAKDNKQRMVAGGVFLIELMFTGLVSGLAIGLAHTMFSRWSFIAVFAQSFHISATVLTGANSDRERYSECLTVLNGLCWLIYALLKFDIFLMAANFVGIIILCLQALEVEDKGIDSLRFRSKNNLSRRLRSHKEKMS